MNKWYVGWKDNKKIEMCGLYSYEAFSSLVGSEITSILFKEQKQIEGLLDVVIWHPTGHGEDLPII